MTDQRTLSYIDTTQSARDKRFRAPYLAVVMDCQRPLMAPARYSLAGTDRTAIGRSSRRGAGYYRTCARTTEDSAAVQRLAFDDHWMSSNHAQLVKNELGWSIVDPGSKNGTYLNGERVQAERLRDGDVIEIGAKLFLFRDSVEWSIDVPTDVDLLDEPEPITALATLSVPLAHQIRALRRVAPTQSPVLVFGESGSGKELFARAVHELSRRPGPFVAVNCGALPAGVVESQLFGHRKGAFSGADSHHAGLVRSADRGTLFLDEIAELPEPSQVALLRVLQESEVTPVGATKPIRVDIRVVAATHQDIDQRRCDGRFRDDLYARLAGFSIALPQLADRREDIGLITAELLRRIAGERAEQLTLSRDAARALLAYHWPLNIRELEHALGAALALADGDTIELDVLPEAVGEALRAPRRPRRLTPAGVPRAQENLRDATADELKALLAEHNGNISAVARTLGRSRVHLHRLLKRLGIDADQYRR